MKIKGLVNKLQGTWKEINEKRYKKGQECLCFKNVKCFYITYFTKMFKTKGKGRYKHFQNSTLLLEKETVMNKTHFDDL